MCLDWTSSQSKVIRSFASIWTAIESVVWRIGPCGGSSNEIPWSQNRTEHFPFQVQRLLTRARAERAGHSLERSCVATKNALPTNLSSFQHICHSIIGLFSTTVPDLRIIVLLCARTISWNLPIWAMALKYVRAMSQWVWFTARSPENNYHSRQYHDEIIVLKHTPFRHCLYPRGHTDNW